MKLPKDFEELLYPSAGKVFLFQPIGTLFITLFDSSLSPTGFIHFFHGLWTKDPHPLYIPLGNKSFFSPYSSTYEVYTTGGI